MTTSLLAHIVKGYASRQWENIATDSLHYLLRQEPAQEAVARLLAEHGISRSQLRWETQVSSEDRARPDLVGLDAAGKPAVMIEVKFWASLTDNQPNGYLANQVRAFPGSPEEHLLVFLVPNNREQVIVRELARRVSEDGGESGIRPTTPQERLALSRVAVVTWHRLLREIRTALTAAEDAKGLEDLNQLQGLCDRADAEAMLPISAEEIDPVYAQRYRDYSDLAKRAAHLIAVADGFSMEARKRPDGDWGVGMYIQSTVAGTFWFGFYPSYWAQHYATPWWLQISKKAPRHVHEAVVNLGRSSRLPYVGNDDGLTIIAVPPPLGMEREDAARCLAEFVVDVLASLEHPNADAVTAAQVTRNGHL